MATVVSGYKVLVVAPVSGKSHWLYMENFVKEFVHRKHEVTCITPFKLSGPKLENYTEILADPPFNIHSLSKLQKQFTVKLIKCQSEGQSFDDTLKYDPLIYFFRFVYFIN